MTLKPKPLASDLIASKVKTVEIVETPSPLETLTARKIQQIGEPLNFRVKKDFKRLFKATAAQHGLKMNQLLVEAFDIWMREKGRE